MMTVKLVVEPTTAKLAREGDDQTISAEAVAEALQQMHMLVIAELSRSWAETGKAPKGMTIELSVDAFHSGADPDRPVS